MVFRVFYQRKKGLNERGIELSLWAGVDYGIFGSFLSGAVKVAFPYMEGDLGFPWLLLARIPHLIPRPQMRPISLVSGPLSKYVKLGGTSI